ncbi:MAG TPA: alpha/beta hydrolase [Propionibacteriaceae bacterium]|nr:alpha/beta hydrolase [Propionibacteriaceae bacterium]
MLLRAVVADKRLAWGLALLVAVGYGLVAGWWTPRGPMSTFEGLSAMGLALLVGSVAGFVLRTRWAMLVAPVTFVVVFELARLGASGPTVDGIHLGSEYGVMAFALGRGVHALLALLPMVLGAALGAALARRRLSTGRSQRGFLSGLGVWLRRGVALATGLVLVALAAFVARPATTDPIVDADGQAVPGSVAELTRVEIGGHDLALMIRGRSDQNPVLLFLAGGPGGSELGAMRRHSEELEDDFVVATFDQRGTGKSYDQLDPADSLTLDRAVADALEVTNYLRDRFGKDQIYLAGQSWGSLLGVLAVQRQPELYSAFVGVGQMVSPKETDQIFYRDTLAWARETGNTDLVDTLTSSGPPPYENMLDYESALSYELEVYPYSHAGNSEGSGQMGENILVEEYTLLEQAHVFAGVMDTFSVLYPQIQDIDFRTQATSLDVPVYLAQGAHEARGRAEPAQQWFDLLQAPSKKLVTFDTSGHRPLWEQPAEFHDLMTTVLAETAPTP